MVFQNVLHDPAVILYYNENHKYLLYTDALVNSAESLEDEQTSIFDEVLKARHKKKIIHQHLQKIEMLTLDTQCIFMHTILHWLY